MTYTFKPAYMSDIYIGSIPNSFFNQITLDYAYDFASGSYTKALTKKDNASFDFYDMLSAEVFSDNLIYSDASAANYVDSALSRYSGELYVVNFLYGLRSEADRITLFDTGVFSVKYAPSTSGVWADKEGIIETLETTKDGILVSLSVIERSFTSSVSTVEISSTFTLQIQSENLRTKTLTVFDSLGAIVEGAEVTMNKVTLVTDSVGQVTFENLSPGFYSVAIKATDKINKTVEVEV